MQLEFSRRMRDPYQQLPFTLPGVLFNHHSLKHSKYNKANTLSTYHGHLPQLHRLPQPGYLALSHHHSKDGHNLTPNKYKGSSVRRLRYPLHPLQHKRIKILSHLMSHKRRDQRFPSISYEQLSIHLEEEQVLRLRLKPLSRVLYS